MNIANDPLFRTTRWTVVLQAQGEPSTLALDELCQRYWYPLYAFVRRQGHNATEAQDLTQEFFARLLEKQWLDAAKRERGKFRTFLIIAMKRFLANEWKQSQRLKRGGGTPILSLDELEAEERFSHEPCTEEDASLLYDRGWALTLLDRSLQQVEQEQDPEKFEILKPCLIAAKGEFDCTKAAQKLGMSEGTTRVAVHRLRKRYREIFRQEIAQTVAKPEDIDDEVRHLIKVISLNENSV